MWYTHVVFGLLLSLVFLTSIDVTSPFVFILLVLFSSLLPDIDQKDARIHRYVPFTRWIQTVFEHRGIFHSLFPPVFIYIVFLFFKLEWIGFALALGYISHLLLDGLTKMGIDLFYPASMHIRGPIKTGGMMELVLFVIILAGTFYLSF